MATAVALMCADFASASDVASTGPQFGRIPLVFFANDGQLDARAQFAGRVGGMSAFFTQDGFALRLAQRRADAMGGGYEGVNLFYSFEGAAPDVTLRGENELAGKLNFIKGQDPAKWRSGVATYGAIRFDDLYPGIDVVVRDDARRMEYDLVLDPGADLSQVVVRCDGADRLRIDADGALVAETAFGELRQDVPRTWVTRSDGSRTEVECRFQLLDGQRFGFVAPQRDPSAAMVVDPGITYGSYLGGSGNEHGCGVSVDSDCYMYIAGDTLSMDFPVTAGAFDMTQNGNVDVFVTKLVGTGTSLVYSTYVGGTNGDFGHGVYVDANDFVYFTGGTGSNDYPVTAGAFDTTYNGGADTFVSKLSQDGSTLVFSTYLGDAGEEGSLGAQGVIADAAGFVYVSGFTSSANFPTTVGAYDTAYNDNGTFADCFVTKFSPNGANLVYSTLIGGTGLDVSNAINVNAQGEAFIGGFSLSSDFPTTPGAFATVPNINSNGFVCRFDAAGANLVYSTYTGGSSEVVRDIAICPNDEALAGGYTLSTVFPATPGAFDPTPNGNGDGFMMKFNAAGTGLVYASYLGGTAVDVVNAIETDPATGDSYATGWTESNDFPVTNAIAFDSTYNGGPQDAFVSRADSTGATLIYSSFLGGTGYDVGFALNLHDIGAAYIAGGTFSTDFPTVAGSFDTTANGGEDIFMVLMPVGTQTCPASGFGQQYGTGKAGVSGVPVWTNLTQPTVPSLGLQLRLTNAAPSSLCYIVIGTSMAAAPFDGGTLLATPDLVLVAGVTDVVGQLDVIVPIVENPNYCNKQVFTQVLVADASVSTFYGFAMSNGVKLMFGN